MPLLNPLLRGSFNFTFNCGGGDDVLYRATSVRAGWSSLVQHYSNRKIVECQSSKRTVGFARLEYAGLKMK